MARPYDLMKRVVDIIAASTLSVLAVPLLAAVALAVLVESGRPIVFQHERIGRHGNPFVMYKFRTMMVNSEALGFRTLPGDQRITRVGRFLRSSSLDELPQLLNVVRGDMSLVGPRPDVAEQLSDYEPADLQRRLSVRPGITGLAQAELRSEATPEERLALDLRYIDERSLGTDMAVLATTVRRLAGGG